MTIEQRRLSHRQQIVRSSLQADDGRSAPEGSACREPQHAAPHLMVIRRQVRTVFDKVIDLLAIDAERNLAVLAMKKYTMYRDIAAGRLDASTQRIVTYLAERQACKRAGIERPQVKPNMDRSLVTQV